VKQRVTPVMVAIAVIVLLVVIAGIWYFAFGSGGANGDPPGPSDPNEMMEESLKNLSEDGAPAGGASGDG